MEHKKRYCPSCGAKTNDLHCDICERMTKGMEERFKERDLDLIADDIETFDHIQNTHQYEKRMYSDHPIDVQVNLDKVANNVKMHGKRGSIPITSYDSLKLDNLDILKIISIVIVIAVGIVIVVITASN